MSELAQGSAYGHGHPQAWAIGGSCPVWKCCEVFLCISSYSKTLSRGIICSLFSQSVVSFWGLYPRPTPGLHSDPAKDFHPQTPNLPTRGKKSCGRPCVWYDRLSAQ